MSSLKLPPEITQAVVKETARLLAESVSPRIEELQLFTMGDVCRILKVTDKTAKKLVTEYVELGEASHRISATQLRALITKRTFSK